MDIEELKPCPFCGSGVLHKNNPEKMGRTFFVSCGFCDCRGACLPTEQGAVDAWNTRADEFAAMARDAERWRKFCSLDADVYINTTGESFVSETGSMVLAQYLDAMQGNK